ncbi:hypothetical protein [Thermococcus sibiricus]|uniref:Uncharacterized protein n=1 Tax=Thermococcus sibiricus (strain DSM 12597 / MM 739) TaxID=604354 RepID=C6A0Z8_THESM|nr:hypothetical protein [Thermococcus sibiricus]ACS89293.1 hypothetical protein TSIB_0226 [Thermococcus sibiricus MM 739]
MRYGAPFEDIQALLGNVTRAYIRYTLPGKSEGLNLTNTQIAGIGGAIILIGLAVFMLKRR